MKTSEIVINGVYKVYRFGGPLLVRVIEKGLPFRWPSGSVSRAGTRVVYYGGADVPPAHRPDIPKSFLNGDEIIVASKELEKP